MISSNSTFNRVEFNSLLSGTWIKEFNSKIMKIFKSVLKVFNTHDNPYPQVDLSNTGKKSN